MTQFSFESTLVAEQSHLQENYSRKYLKVFNMDVSGYDYPQLIVSILSGEVKMGHPPPYLIFSAQIMSMSCDSGVVWGCTGIR